MLRAEKKRLPVLSLALLLVAILIVLALALPGEQPIAPNGWQPLAVTLQATTTPSGGWWHNLPTTTPVNPDPTPFPQEAP